MEGAPSDFATLAYAHAPVGIVYAEERVMKWANPCFVDMFESTLDGIVGQPLAIFYPSQREYDRIGRIGPEQMLKTGRYADQRIMKRAGGGLFWCKVHGHALDNRDPFARSVWAFSDLADLVGKPKLSPRQMEVARFLANGCTSKEIARALNISPRTVDSHRAQLLKKLRAKNTIDLVSRLTAMG